MDHRSLHRRLGWGGPANGRRAISAGVGSHARSSYFRASFHEPIGALIAALEDAGHDYLARIVETNRDSPFKSPVEDEQRDELLAELCKRNEGELAERVQRGRYTMSQSEMEAWEESGAEQVALRATEAYAVNRERAER